MAGFAELVIDIGSDFNTYINISDDTTGVSLNVTNFTVASQVRRSFYSLTPTIVFTCAVVDGPNGNVSIALTSANTANVRPGRYVYDVKIKSPANSVTRVVEGIITFNPTTTTNI